MHKTRIPTFLGLLLVFGAVFIFSLVFERVTPLLSRASPSITPANVVISNVTDTSFSVSWTTPNPATGALAVEDTTGTKYTAFDDRDQQLSPSSTQSPLGRYTTHMVTTRSGKPNTLYHMRIVSDGKVFSDGPKTYDVTTGPTLSSSGTTLEPAFGTVTTPTDLPADGALIYLALEGSQTLSTLVKSKGSWVMPLHFVRTEDYQSFISSGERIAESIIVRTSDGDATAVTDTINDNPVPVMTIGKSYDFRKIQAAQPEPTPPHQLALSHPPQPTTAAPAVLGTNIQTPSGILAFVAPKNGAALSTNLPLIQGTGVPGNVVQFILGITHPQTGSTTVEADGVWRYTPTTPLSAGRQSITMTTKDAQNKSKAITHTFEILKSGTQVLGDATPSATLAPTPTIDVTPTEVATLAGDPIPETGSSLPLIILLILGVGLFTRGIFVFIR